MALSTYPSEWSNDDLQQDVSAARWVTERLGVVPNTTVGSLVPTVFDAYARVVYPYGTTRQTVAPWLDQLAAILEILTRTTTTPDDCYFAVWEGNTALEDIRDIAPTATIAGYNYFLLTGSVARATDTLAGLSPHLWWPTDHAWCVAQHFDFPCAYLGGSAETVADVLALDDIESQPVRVDQIITAGH
ncbi:putative uncharacterized protein [Rhodococcus sp. AW25M09]|uniref:hypothetical protein n=1 Tax=Rhodococcus sp. AW25M09 TaxID=1268303 RepID=UPI0002ACA7EC|nr:hypothetical protein [Rhodococcus sp. AW25M09]CCQ14315.1 putative uncharacterized protein [Rhodococcus sp. AW25M09]